MMAKQRMPRNFHLERDTKTQADAPSIDSTTAQKMYLKPSELARKLRDVEKQVAEELERSEQFQANLRVSGVYRLRSLTIAR